jgi:hypothetical protein
MGLFFGSLYLVATFIRPQDLFVVLAPYNTMDILAGLAVGGALLDLAAGRSRPALLPQLLLLPAFVGWASLTVILVLRWFGGAWQAFQELSISTFVFLVLVLTGTSMVRLRVLSAALLSSLLVLCGFALYAYFKGGPWQRSFVLEDRRTQEAGVEEPVDIEPTSEDQDVGPAVQLPGWLAGGVRPRRLRGLGFLNDPNDLSQVLVAMIPIAFLAWRQRQPLANLVLVWLPICVFLYSIWLSRSRGAAIALAALLGFAFSARIGGKWSRALDAIGWAGLLVMLVAFFRLGYADASALGRREAWSEGLFMLRSSPIWGAGFYSFGEADRVAHNSFVHCFGELGLVGYGLWLAAILVTLHQLDGLRTRDPDSSQGLELARWANVLRLSLMSFLVSSLFLSRTYSPTLFLLLGLPTAVVSVARAHGIRVGPRPFPFVIEVAAATLGTVLIAYVVTRLSW